MAVLSHGQVAQADVADSNARECGDTQSDRFAHPSDLSVAPLVQLYGKQRAAVCFSV